MNAKEYRPDTGEIDLGYGRDAVRLRLPPKTKAEVLLPPRTANTDSVQDLLARSLESPVGSAPLRDLAAGKRSATIAVPDKTRPPVARDILPLLVDELESAGVPGSGIRIFIASGIHARHSDDEIRPLVGEETFGRFEVCQNDGHRAEDFVSLGTTSRGTPVEVNRALAGADLVLAVGGLAFHYFAGFTGGRKMILPGAASVNAVKNNHRLTLVDSGEINPACVSGLLDGNPVHEDMIEAAGFLAGDVYLVNVIRDGWGSSAAVLSGDLFDSHVLGTEVVRGLFECRLRERCDIAIASAGGHPLDMNMIQAHKSLEHAAASVRDGGVVIGVLGCEDGVGSGTFLPWFEYGDSGEIARNLYENYELNGHTALSFVKKRERVNLILVTDLPGDVIDSLGVTRADGIDEALARAEALAGADPRVYVFPRAWGLLPVVES